MILPVKARSKTVSRIRQLHIINKSVGNPEPVVIRLDQ